MSSVQPYYIKTFPLSIGSFWVADLFCKTMNSTLVTPKTAAENAFFQSVIETTYASESGQAETVVHIGFVMKAMFWLFNVCEGLDGSLLCFYLGLIYNGPNNSTWADGSAFSWDCRPQEWCGGGISSPCLFFCPYYGSGTPEWSPDGSCSSWTPYACQSTVPCKPTPFFLTHPYVK